MFAKFKFDMKFKFDTHEIKQQHNLIHFVLGNIWLGETKV